MNIENLENRGGKNAGLGVSRDGFESGSASFSLVTKGNSASLVLSHFIHKIGIK